MAVEEKKELRLLPGDLFEIEMPGRKDFLFGVCLPMVASILSLVLHTWHDGTGFASRRNPWLVILCSNRNAELKDWPNLSSSCKVWSSMEFVASLGIHYPVQILGPDASTGHFCPSGYLVGRWWRAIWHSLSLLRAWHSPELWKGWYSLEFPGRSLQFYAWGWYTLLFWVTPPLPRL